MEANARVQLLVQGLRAATFACLCFLPSLAWAAVYGSDGYGGGGFGTGVEPAPAHPAAAPAGGVIGGPMSVGYVVSNPSSTIVISTTTVQLAPSRAAAPRVPFRHLLQYRDRDPDVRRLQVLLNQAGFVVAATGPGSPGHETDFFGQFTYAALIRLQEAHAQEILAPLGLAKGTGYFGAATMAFFNAIEF